MKCSICHEEEGHGKNNICRKCWRKEHDKQNKQKLSLQARNRYLRNKEERIKKTKDWQKKNMARTREKHREYYRKNPELKNIRNKTILKYGYLMKDAVCDICRIEGVKLQFHHTTEPYEVDKFMIVCPNCHTQIHAKFGKLKQYYPLEDLGENNNLSVKEKHNDINT